MTSEELFIKLKAEIAGDLHPVKPLASPGYRALFWAPLYFVLGGAVVFLTGLRADYAQLGFWGTFGPASLQMAAGCFLGWIGLRSSIPGMLVPASRPWAAGAVAAGLYLLASGFIKWMSPVSPPEGMDLRSGLACLGAISALGLVPLVLGLVLARRGLPLQWGILGLMLGLGSGLAAEASWRLHCSFSNWEHVLSAHVGGIVLLAALSAGAVWVWRGRG